MKITEQQAFTLHQIEVNKILKQYEDKSKVSVYSGRFDNTYITILKSGDDEYKFVQELE